MGYVRYFPLGRKYILVIPLQLLPLKGLEKRNRDWLVQLSSLKITDFKVYRL